MSILSIFSLKRIFCVLFLVSLIPGTALAQSRKELAFRLEQAEARLAQTENILRRLQQREQNRLVRSDELLTRLEELERLSQENQGRAERLEFENKTLRVDLSRIQEDLSTYKYKNQKGSDQSVSPDLQSKSAKIDMASPKRKKTPVNLLDSSSVLTNQDSQSPSGKADFQTLPDRKSSGTAPLKLTESRKEENSASNLTGRKGQTIETGSGTDSRDQYSQTFENKAESTLKTGTKAGEIAQYNKARKLLDQGEFIAAGEAFEQFLDQYPQAKQKAESYYWLGEIRYIQSYYKRAASSYIQSLKVERYGKRAPEAMIMLGASLSAMGKQSEACQTLNQVFSTYPKAEKQIKEKAEAEIRRAKCT